MSRVINTTAKNLRNYSKKQLEAVKNLIADTATSIEIQATRDAPSAEDTDGFINIDKNFTNKGLTAEVGVMGENKLAAYFEFGTGLSAASILAPYPQWVKDTAYKFYINGLGTLKGKPYLYPAVFLYTKDLQVQLAKLTDTKEVDG